MVEVYDNELKNKFKDMLNKLKPIFSFSNNIESITIDPLDSINRCSIEDIIQFKNLKDITIFNTSFNTKKLYIFQNFTYLNSLTFINCDFDTILPLTYLNIEKIEFNDCLVDDIKLLNNVKCIDSISLINMNSIDLNDLPILNKIKNLNLCGSSVINIGNLEYFDNLEYLGLLNVDNLDLNVILKLKNLKRLEINRITALNNKEIVGKLNCLGINAVDEMNQNLGDYYE